MKKNDREQKTVHHRKPRSKGGTDHPENISQVKRKFHEAYHLLFADKSPQQVATILTDIWIDPAWELTATLKKPPLKTSFDDY